MTQRASTCLSLLAILSSFPLSLGEATQMSGSSLVGVQSVSEILDQFFKNQERAGRKPPVWKQEAQAMISMMQSLRDINSTTQATVDGYVRNIIQTLWVDVNNTAVEQARAKRTLDRVEAVTRTELEHLDAILVKLKNFSAIFKACRDNVTALKTGYYNDTRNGSWKCNDTDRTGPNSTCPTECGKPSIAQFELTPPAKKLYACDFEAGDTPEQCVDRLWEKVNVTRVNLTNKYTAWAAKKRDCDEHMSRCATCTPLWNAMLNKKADCDGKRLVGYAGYCTLQTEQNDFCYANETMYATWFDEEKPAQEARVREYSDLMFIICIFEKYLDIHDFTHAMISNCTRKTAQDFYNFANPPGELFLPFVNSSHVPDCYGNFTHIPGSPLWDMTGLVNEFIYDGFGTTIYVTDKVYTPTASGAVCNIR